jgi:hypothetical protein
MGILDNYEAADQAFRTKAVLTQDNATLLEHLHGLSNQNNTNTGTQHRDIIRGLTINNILLQRHIDGLNKQNTKTQRLVIALTIASLIGTAAQVWYAAKADKTPEEKAPPIAAPQQAPAQQSAAPSPESHQASGQPKKKAP